MAGFTEYLTQLEQSRGLPPGYLTRTRQIESSGGKHLASPLSSARGDFQFIGKTAKAYGVDVNDPYSGARGAADYAADNAKRFQAALGRTPTGADLYGMHQQGPQGYLSLTRGQIPSQKALANNGGAGMSAEQFLAKLNAKFNNTPLAAGVEPSRGPTVASAMAANTPLPGSQGPTLPIDAANPAVTTPAPTPPPNTSGGLLGVLNGEGKIADLLQSKSYAPAVSGVLSALGGGQQVPARPAMQFAPVTDDENKPNMGLLQMLQRRKMMGMA